MDSALKLKILFVEDESDIRETLTEILHLHDYQVLPVATAEAGLAELRRDRFDLLLSDYNLPEHSGSWLVEQARAQGLLEGTAAMVVTAHPAPQLPDDVAVMRKPLDVDRFLQRLAQLLEPAAAAKVRQAQSELGRSTLASGRGPALHLTLYVSPDSPASLRAVRNLKTLLEREPDLPIELGICDITAHASQAAADRISLTPTLVKKGPGPRAWIVGTLDDLQPVLDLLDIAGLARSAG